MSDKALVLGYRSIRQRSCGNFQGNIRFLKKFMLYVFDKYNRTNAQKIFFGDPKYYIRCIFTC